jgi:hypothetical protein
MVFINYILLALSHHESEPVESPLLLTSLVSKIIDSFGSHPVVVSALAAERKAPLHLSQENMAAVHSTYLFPATVNIVDFDVIVH